MLINLIEIIVKVILYTIFFFGIWKIVVYLLEDIYRVSKLRRRKRNINSKNKSSVEKLEQNPIHKHCKLLVNAVLKNPKESSVLNFYAITIGIFIVVNFTVYQVTNNILMALFSSCILAITPYILLRFRIADIRIKSSYSFLNEFNVILQNYQYEKDVYRTIMALTTAIKDKNMKYMFSKILSVMQKERTDEAFKEAVQTMAFSVGSSFSLRFAILLTKGYTENVDISRAMMDLHEDVIKRQKDIEIMKSKSLETVILGFMPLAIIPLFVYMGYKVSFIYTFEEITKQTNSTYLLIVSILLAVLCALTSYLFRKPKADM